MTAPPPDRVPATPAPTTPARRPWFARPWVVFGVLGLLIVGTVLLTPEQGRRGSGQLTTLSREPEGARLLADLADRTGWTVVRDSSVPTRDALPADRVYAVLDPPEALTGREYGRLLDAVRRGAGLLVVHPGGGAVEDSLGIERKAEGARMLPQRDALAACPAEEPRYGISWGHEDVMSYWLVSKRPLADTVHFLPLGRYLTSDERKSGVKGGEIVYVDDDGAPRTETAAQRQGRRRVRVPAAIGLPLGRGRVVVVADPDWLRNDVLRVCRWHAAVTSMRMLDWLAAAGAGRTVVFDEWHQGRGVHPSAGAAFVEFAGRDPRGRALLQGILAALVLLAALGARPLVPALPPRVERRSPFEHVGALARAYEEIGATRVVARRLVRGLRRRLGAAATVRDEEGFLAALEARHPSLAGDIALVRAALDARRTPAELLEVGRAVARIEKTIKTS